MQKGARVSEGEKECAGGMSGNQAAQRDQEGERHICAFTFAPPQAAKQPDATGALPLDIAGSTGASGEVKDAIVRACPEVVTSSTLDEVLKRNWGEEAARVSLASAPEVKSTRLMTCLHRLAL